MASFYVLTAPAPKDVDRDTVFIRDGFSWAGLLFPLPWLLLKRMWLVALLAFVFYMVAVYAAEVHRFDALPMAFSVVLSLWVALEGGHARAMLLERRGWTITRVIEAERLADAEAIYFADLAAGTPREERAVIPAAQTARALPATGALALGLLDPGGRR